MCLSKTSIIILYNDENSYQKINYYVFICVEKNYLNHLYRFVLLHHLFLQTNEYKNIYR